MAKKTIEQVDVKSKRVLMRVDFNVPLDESGKIKDDRRIQQALPSIKSVVDRGGKLILMSHLGRPDGKGFEPEFSLKPAATRLGELLTGVSVQFPGQDCASPEVAKAVDEMNDGDVIVLENLRFHPGEKKSDPDFASKLAAYGDIYCNDAFGTSHREDGSMVAVPKAMEGKPRVAGLLLVKEYQYLSETISNPNKPFVAVLGGAKVSGKLGALKNLIGKVETILIGGAMAYTFLKALGHGTGSSKVQAGMMKQAESIIDLAAASPTDLILPKDHVCGKQISRMTPVEVHTEHIPDGWMGLDVGPETTAEYTKVLHTAKTIVWNGPMGVFETPPFEVGTHQIAEAIAQATANGAISVIGGGETAAAVEQFNLADRFSHVSTGGGASLELLEGKSFASVDVLDEV